MLCLGAVLLTCRCLSLCGKHAQHLHLQQGRLLVPPRCCFDVRGSSLSRTSTRQAPALSAGSKHLPSARASPHIPPAQSMMAAV